MHKNNYTTSEAVSLLARCRSWHLTTAAQLESPTIPFPNMKPAEAASSAAEHRQRAKVLEEAILEICPVSEPLEEITPEAHEQWLREEAEFAEAESEFSRMSKLADAGDPTAIAWMEPYSRRRRYVLEKEAA